MAACRPCLNIKTFLEEMRTNIGLFCAKHENFLMIGDIYLSDDDVY